MSGTVTCSVCEIVLTEDDQRAMTACAMCARTLGIVPMPESTRPPRPCMRCNEMEFLRVIQREYSAQREGESNRQVAGPMYLTHQAQRMKLGPNMFFATPVEIENQGLGMVETFVCRSCGFIELYCPTVREIPASPITMTEIIDYKPKAPFR